MARPWEQDAVGNMSDGASQFAFLAKNYQDEIGRNYNMHGTAVEHMMLDSFRSKQAAVARLCEHGSGLRVTTKNAGVFLD
jgi:hypothetical protein